MFQEAMLKYQDRFAILQDKLRRTINKKLATHKDLLKDLSDHPILLALVACTLLLCTASLSVTLSGAAFLATQLSAAADTLCSLSLYLAALVVPSAIVLQVVKSKPTLTIEVEPELEQVANDAARVALDITPEGSEGPEAAPPAPEFGHTQSVSSDDTFERVSPPTPGSPPKVKIA